MHDQLFEVLDDPALQKVVVCAPRGMAKTTITGLLHPAKMIFFNELKFLVYISDSATQAEAQTETLKAKFTLDEGRLKGAIGDISSDIFAREHWMTANGIHVLPRGSNQKVRGLKYGDCRPDQIICDDLENIENVQNPDQRKKLKTWFFGDVMNAVDIHRGRWRVFVIGTLLHQDSLLSNLLDDPTWARVKLKMMDSKGHSAWPAVLSDDALQTKLEDHRRQGIMDVFSREMQGEPISDESRRFHKKFFKYYDELDLRGKNVETIVIVDPAKTVESTSCYSGIIAWGIDQEHNKFYARETVNKRLEPDQIYDEAIDMCVRVGAYTIFVESTSLEDFILTPLRNRVLERGLPISIEPIKPDGKSKEERVGWLLPMYRRGQIFHNKTLENDLETQLMSWPFAKYIDLADAAAYLPKIIGLGGRFYSGDPEKQLYDEGLKQYEGHLERELAAVRSGDWRVI